MNLGSDSLGKSNDLGVSSVRRIYFGFTFIANPDPDPIIEYAVTQDTMKQQLRQQFSVDWTTVTQCSLVNSCSIATVQNAAARRVRGLLPGDHVHRH